MPFIDKQDTPELLKARVNGKDGFVVLPQGEDCDGVYFTSIDALRSWTAELAGLAAEAEHALQYEEWLDQYTPDADDEEI